MSRARRQRIKAAIFDVGETLIDESRLWRSWAEWLGVPEHVLFAVLGAVIARREHHHRLFEILSPGFDLEAQRRKRICAGCPDTFLSSDLYPDALPCLAALRRGGLKIGVAGNQPQGFQGTLEQLGLSLDLVGSSSDWGVAKPAPEFFHRISNVLQMEPSSIAYISDRLDTDILPARDMGMWTVFIRRGPWGFLHSRERNLTAAHVVVNDLTELPHALGIVAQS